MSIVEFLFAILALLVTPGPTNTLLALSGSAVGLRRSLFLIPAELSGYLLGILPLTLFGADLLASWPLAANVVKLTAAIWVMWLAVKLWHAQESSKNEGRITGRSVFVTTVLNPKALIFGLVLLPGGDSPNFLTYLALFCTCVVVVATLWAAAGASLSRDTSRMQLPQLYRRTAACWLAVLSLGLVVGALSA